MKEPVNIYDENNKVKRYKRREGVLQAIYSQGIIIITLLGPRVLLFLLWGEYRVYLLFSHGINLVTVYLI